MCMHAFVCACVCACMHVCVLALGEKIPCLRFCCRKAFLTAERRPHKPGESRNVQPYRPRQRRHPQKAGD